MKKQRIKTGTMLTANIIQLCDDNLEIAKCKSRNDFIEDAIMFYAGYLHKDDNIQYNSQTIESLIVGTVCDISVESLLHRLAVNSHITSIYLCLDNDEAGNDATNRITSNLCSQYKVFAIKSTFKDFNEDLKFKNNQPVISATIDSTIETKIELLKDCSSLMVNMKTKNINDLVTTYSPFLYNYDSPFIKVKTEAQYKLLIACATSLIIAKQQFKHLEKNYTNDEMIDILKGSKEYNIKPKNIKSIPQDLVQKISEIKLMNQENIYMTKECKVQYIQLYIDFASFCLNTYVYLLNIRKVKQIWKTIK